MSSKTFSWTVLAVLTITTVATAVKYDGFNPFLPSKISAHHSQTARTFKEHSGWIYAIAISPDGNTLISSSYNGTIKIWNLQAGKLLHTINGLTDAVASLAISSNGHIFASGSWDHRIKLWNLEQGKLIRTLSGHADDVESVAFTPDGKILASGSWDHTVKLWNVETGQVIRTLNQKGAAILIMRIIITTIQNYAKFAVKGMVLVSL